MGLNLNVYARITGAYSGANDLAAPSQAITIEERLGLLTGVTAGKSDLMFADRRTLAASATENLDLSGVLADAFGQVLTFVKVKALLVKADAANVNDVVVGGAASNGFATPFGDPTDKVLVKPGGFLLLAADAGYVVTPGTGDLLKVANSAGSTSVTYDIVLVGTSA